MGITITLLALFYPVGGLLTTLGGLLAAIPGGGAGVLRGWRRWASPALAGYSLRVLDGCAYGFLSMTAYTVRLSCRTDEPLGGAPRAAGRSTGGLVEHLTPRP